MDVIKKTLAPATYEKAHAPVEPETLDEIESHTIVQFGTDINMKIYMFGGYINNAYSSNRMFTLAPKQACPRQLVLEEIVVASPNGSIPGPRHDHSMTSTRKDANEIMVFGGILSNLDKRCNELWRFDMAKSTWKLLSGAVDFE